MDFKPITLLYSVTLFLSAMLMFVLEPLFAKLLLPVVGGAPAVWPTSMAFYQLLLLAGYGFAHLLGKQRDLRLQVAIALMALVAPLALLPIGLSQGLQPPTSTSPVYWLLGTMAFAIGAPFFALCILAPLLQRWFSEMGDSDRWNPYFLYAASNAGSMMALLSYPFLIEPWIPLRHQSSIWAGLYSALIVLVLVCAWCLLKTRKEVRFEDADSSQSLSWSLRGRWVFLAFVPSSLVLGLTSFLTTDIAAVPLLWVLPLAAYLLSFIIVFARRQVVPHAWVMRVFPWALAAMTVFLAVPVRRPYWLVMGVLFVAFFVTALAAHGELAKLRPAPRSLTIFYFCMALGGALGGCFNAILAPAIFHSIAEYPIAALLAAIIVPTSIRYKRIWIVASIALAGAAWMLLVFWKSEPMLLGVLITLGIVGSFLSKNRWAFSVALGLTLILGQFYRPSWGQVIVQERSFFGVIRVLDDGTFHYLYHGTTLHGAQAMSPKLQQTPLTYYFPTGPIGTVFSSIEPRRLRRVALVGLGAGSLLTYAKPEQQWTIYEIDPNVVSMAFDPKCFTYANNPRLNPPMVRLGDARLELEHSKEKYDLLILDAYSSDSLPVHLLTREALKIYLDHLEPHGVIAFHISNNRMELEPLLDSLFRDAGIAGRLFEDSPLNPFVETRGKAPSEWVIAAGTPEDLAFITPRDRWRTLVSRPGFKVWTDDYSSLVSVLKL